MTTGFLANFSNLKSITKCTYRGWMSRGMRLVECCGVVHGAALDIVVAVGASGHTTG